MDNIEPGKSNVKLSMLPCNPLTSECSPGPESIIEEGACDNSSPESSHAFNSSENTTLGSSTNTRISNTTMDGSSNSCCDDQLPLVYHIPSHILQMSGSQDRHPPKSSHLGSYNNLKRGDVSVDYGQKASSFHNTLSNDHHDGLWHDDELYHLGQQRF